MSTPANATGSQDAIPGLEPGPGPAPIAPPQSRHPLGLPAGSVRALLALLVLGMLWIIALLHTEGSEVPQLFVYLLYLFILMLASFFASHDKSIGAPLPFPIPSRGEHSGARSHPLRLPRRTVRFLLLVGFAGLIAWLHWNRRDLEGKLWLPGYVPLILLGSFLLGYLVSGMVHALAGANTEPARFQDIRAWLSLIAVLMLGIALLAEIINLGLPEDLKIAMPVFEACLAGVVGFYFGSRS